MNRVVLLLALATLATACTSNARKVQLQNAASLNVDAHTLWSRPTEVGYRVGDQIFATATSDKVLGFHVGEARPGSDVLSVVLPPSGGGLSPLEEFAAYKAVAESGAEGIYVTRIESESRGFLFFFRHQEVTLYGRALTLQDYGPVAENRADLWRFRKYQPEVVVVKDGEANLTVPISK